MKTTQFIKHTKDLHKHLSKEDIEMANEKMLNPMNNQWSANQNYNEIFEAH